MEIFLLELGLTVFIGLCCMFSIKNQKIYKIIFLSITGFMLTIVSGLRSYIIGSDTIQFYNAFNVIKNNQYGWFENNKTRYEIGYFWLNKIVGIFSDNPQIFIFITSLIIVIGVVYFIYENSSNVIFSMILFQTMYHYSNSMNISRQYIAVSIAINSFTFVKQKKFYKACILILIAGLFHTSAFLTLPVIIIFSKININSKNINKIIASIIIAVMAMPIIINFAIKVFPRYEFYLTYTSNFDGGKIMPVLYLGIIFVGYYLIKVSKIPEKRCENYYYISLYVLIGAILLIIANLYFESASRITNYFLIYFILLIPEIFRLFEKNIRVTLYIVFFILSTVYYVILLKNGVAGVVPFKFYLQ